MSQPKTVLISGASGFLGHSLCEYFRQRGARVRGFVRRPLQNSLSHAGVELFHCDLPDEIDEAAFEGSDLFIHCAYTTRDTSRQQARRVNHLGTMRLYELSQQAGVSRFVFISSTGSGPDAESFYGRSKYRLEKEMNPARDLIVRPGLILGAGPNSLFHRMRRSIERLPIIPVFDGGHQTLQTIHVDDLCRAIELAISKCLTGVLVVAEPKGLEMRVFLRRLAAKLGRRRMLVSMPLAAALILTRAFERLRIPLPLTSENLLGLRQMKLVPSVEDLSRIGLEVRTAEQSLEAILSPQ